MPIVLVSEPPSPCRIMGRGLARLEENRKTMDPYIGTLDLHSLHTLLGDRGSSTSVKKTEVLPHPGCNLHHQDDITLLVGDPY